LKEGSVPFPQTSLGEATQPPVCHVPSGSSSDTQALECICTLDGKTCGAGMANAFGAVKAALRPIAAVAVTQGPSVTLNAQNSAAATGHGISSYQWASVGKQEVALSNATGATATATAPSCGFGTVRLTVTDDAGRVDTADVVLSPTSATSLAPANATDRACSATALAPVVAVCPGAASVAVSSGPQTFAASVANTTDDSVTWQVSGVVGGDARVGTITSTGIYTPPAQVDGNTQVVIEAVLNSDRTVEGTSTVNLTSTNGTGSSGGGAIDLWTLLAQTVALGLALAARCYASR